MALRQFLGNLVDRAGTALNLPERNLSEWITGGKQTKYTGITPQSQNFGFVRNTGGDQALNIRSTRPQVMSGVQQQFSRNIQGQRPAPAGTPSLAEWNRREQQKMQQNVNTGGGLSMNIPSGGSSQGGGGSSQGGGMSQAEQEAQQRADEERRLIAERERENEEFRNRLGTQYGETRTRFNELLGGFNEKLKTLPEQLRQLGQQYKSVIGEKQTQDINQLGQRREQVAMQQKEGLSGIAEQVGRRVREGAGRLGSLGMASSAAGMFQRAIQNEANKSARDLSTQAANNYQELDAEENRIKSAYKTMIDEADARENQNIQDIQKNVNTIIEEINENLRQSGEYETLDKKDLTNRYLQELTNRFQIAKQNSESYKQQLEQARRENESAIRNLKNQLVQDFIPKEIQPRELTGVIQSREQEAGMEQGLNPRLLRRVPEDNEEIGTPQGLQAITRRLRQNINQ